MIVFLHESDYEHMNNIIKFFVYVSITYHYIFTYLCELENVCFRMLVEYF